MTRKDGNKMRKILVIAAIALAACTTVRDGEPYSVETGVEPHDVETGEILSTYEACLMFSDMSGTECLDRFGQE